jgi:hypothetical protein
MRDKSKTWSAAPIQSERKAPCNACEPDASEVDALDAIRVRPDRSRSTDMISSGKRTAIMSDGTAVGRVENDNSEGLSRIISGVLLMLAIVTLAGIVFRLGI